MDLGFFLNCLFDIANLFAVQLGVWLDVSLS